MWAKVLDNQLGFLPKNRTKLWKIGDLMLKKISAECKVQGIKHSLNSLAEFQKNISYRQFQGQQLVFTAIL